jgi:CBS domain containing-hemolysin-like protein
MVETAEDEGVIPASEGEMIDNIFDAGDRPIRDVMIPRVDVVAVAESSEVKEAKQTLIQSGHTRLPVYRESMDNIIGVIHAKDLLQELPPNAVLEDAPNLIRPTIYIPEGRTVNTLLRELRQQRTHMAIVLDEYGGTAGVITLEDLLEEIVGPIRDEYEHQEIPELVWINPQTVLVNGSLPLGEFADALDITLGPEAEDADTVGGLIYTLSGKIPHEGEIINLPEVTLKVTQMQNRRVSRIEAHRKAPILPGSE